MEDHQQVIAEKRWRKIPEILILVSHLSFGGTAFEKDAELKQAQIILPHNILLISNALQVVLILKEM